MFGRNATAGVIQVFTPDPSQDFVASGHVGYGNYDTTKLDGYVGGGITSTLAADLSFVASKQGDGWGHNIDTGQVVNQNDHDDTVRSKWIFTPMDGTKLTAIGDYRDQKGSFAEPRIPNGSVSAAGTYDRGGPWDTDADYTNDLNELRDYGVSLKLDQEVGFATFMNMTAFRSDQDQFNLAANFAPQPGVIVYSASTERQLSEEFQLSSHESSPVKWTTGMYYFNEYGAFSPIGVVVPDVLTEHEYFSQHIISGAGYGQAAYEILPATNLTLGARYTHEQHSVQGIAYGALIDGTPLGVVEQDNKKGVSFEKVTYRVALDHRFSPDVMTYVSFNTGFKSGGFNTTAPSDNPYEPETLAAYEIGVKMDLLDHRLRLNADSFYYNYKDLQVQKSIGLEIGIINAASARIYGLETDFEAVITEHFHFLGSMGYTNAKYSEFNGAPFSSSAGGTGLTPGDASGNYLTEAPLFQSNLTGDYRFDLPASSTLHLTASWMFNSGYYLQPDNVLHQPSYSKINASAYWESATKKYNVRLWGDNLTDAAVISYGNDQAPQGVHYVVYEAPRTYGVTFGFKY